MVIIIRFEEIEYLSKLSKEKFGVDIVSEITGLIQVYSIERYSLLSTIGVMSTHFKIQKGVTKSDAVEGYEELLNALNNEIREQDFDVYQVNVVTENSGYMFFTDLDMKQLFGILKMNKQRVVRNVELTEKNELRGTWGGRKFFLNGIELT